MQEIDGARRLAILRGETPPPIPEDEEAVLDVGPSARHSIPGEKRKRKRAGEDDTDFEMRQVKERAEIGERAARELALGAGPAKKSSSTEVALVDSAGHISLFQPPIPDGRGREKNKEAEREEARKKREIEDQFQMRLVNAAGKDGLGLTDGGPWYSAPDGDAALVVPSKNVFGRDDPRRKSREAARLDASDPLAMMKSAAAKVRELEKERKRVNEEREEELRALRKEERREKKRHRTTEDGRRDRDEDKFGRDRHSRSERTSHPEHRSRDRSRDRRHSGEADHDRRHRDEDKHRHRHHHDRPQRSEDDRHRHKRHHRDRDAA